eukprot:TRINITY_DN255_c0_g1_i1.p1 TRINITY_DN255_c0_g1~~TRINITY_DN255_c0_g1_i1.p1  ORF type:complete len:1146 (+),score=427.06 TRINITY_DN255_c0_g1_i1:46-3483(+)
MPPKGKKAASKASSQGTDKAPHANLLGVVRDGGSVQPEIQSLIEKAGINEKEAVAVLVNFVICSCGMKETVEGWQIGHDDAKGVLVDLSDRIAQHMSEKYPLASKEKKWEKFKFNYQNFWRQLMKGLEKDGLLYTSEFTDTLIKWLGGLSVSKVRAFRHHASVAIYNLMTAASKLASSLIGLGGKLADKSSKKSAQPAQAEVSKKLQRMKTVLETAFDISCLSRHKDIVPEIRALTIAYQHEWIVAYPELFVSDDYTKILGWALYDKDEAVRRNTLLGLQDVFSIKSSFTKMSAWLTKFLIRIQEMTLDQSPAVSIEALNLVTILIESETIHRKELFSENVQDGFIEFIHDERASIRQAAARVFHLVMTNRVKAKLPAKASQEDTSKGYLTQVVEWMANLKGRSDLVPACVVEALTNAEAYTPTYKEPVFQNFKVLVDIIEDSDAEDSMVVAALRLLLAVVRKAHGKLDLSFPVAQDKVHPIPKARRTKLDKSWTDPKGSILVSLKEMLPAFIPAMLVKMQTDEVCVQLLGQMVQVVDPAMWSAGGKATEEQFNETLAIMEKLYTTRIQEDTVDSLAVAWRQLTVKEHPLRDAARLAWGDVAAKVCQLKGPKKSQTKAMWLRLTAALEANLDIIDLAWEKILEAMEKPATVKSEYCSEVICAAVAGLLIRTYKARSKMEEGIDLGEEMMAVVTFLRAVIHSESEATREAKSAAFKGLTNTWTLGCGLEVIPRPDESMQMDYALMFDELVPHLPSKTARTLEENITAERDILSHVMCMAKMLMQEYIDEKWVATVFLKWPSLPGKAQEEVKMLHGSYTKRAWLMEKEAIILANHKYHMAKEEDLEASEAVIRNLCVKLAAQNGVGKVSEGSDTVYSLLNSLEEAAFVDERNHFMLYAATPFIRYMKLPDVKKLLAKMTKRGYDVKKHAAIVSFINALKRRTGEQPIGEPSKPAEGKAAKAAASEGKPTGTGKKSEVSTATGSRKRTAQKLHYDEDEEEEEEKIEQPVASTGGKKRKAVSTTEAATTGKSSSKAARTPSLPEPGSSVVSNLDFSMDFGETPEKKAESYSLVFSSLDSSQGSPHRSSQTGGAKTLPTTTGSEVFPPSEPESENVFVASDSDEDAESEEPMPSPPKRAKISTVRNPLKQ